MPDNPKVTCQRCQRSRYVNRMREQHCFHDGAHQTTYLCSWGKETCKIIAKKNRRNDKLRSRVI